MGAVKRALQDRLDLDAHKTNTPAVYVRVADYLLQFQRQTQFEEVAIRG
jgi:hypothetical protein